MCVCVGGGGGQGGCKRRIEGIIIMKKSPGAGVRSGRGSGWM